jgi:hypothetical protein
MKTKDSIQSELDEALRFIDELQARACLSNDDFDDFKTIEENRGYKWHADEVASMIQRWKDKSFEYDPTNFDGRHLKNREFIQSIYNSKTDKFEHRLANEIIQDWKENQHEH